MRAHQITALLAILSFVPSSARASWLSDVTGIDINVPNGTVTINPPRPQDIPQAIAHLPNDISQAMLNPAAPALAMAIRISRNNAMQNDPQPIPDNVRSALSPYFPQNILDHTRWTISNGGLSLATALENWFSAEDAITLDDVIVFRDQTSASSIGLWAHELTHAIQYQSMGVDSFAFNYSYDFNGMEQQARQNSSMVLASINQGQQYSLQVSSDQFSGSQIDWATLNAAAQQIIDPVSCIWINGNMTGNQCPRTIVVTGVVMVNAYGQQATAPCNEQTCVFGANAQGPLLSPPGWQIVGVTAAF